MQMTQFKLIMDEAVAPIEGHELIVKESKVWSQFKGNSAWEEGGWCRTLLSFDYYNIQPTQWPGTPYHLPNKCLYKGTWKRDADLQSVRQE